MRKKVRHILQKIALQQQKDPKRIFLEKLRPAIQTIPPPDQIEVPPQTPPGIGLTQTSSPHLCTRVGVPPQGIKGGEVRGMPSPPEGGYCIWEKEGLVLRILR